MGSHAAPLGDDARYAVMIHLRSHRRGQVIHHQDTVLGQVLQIQLLHPQQDLQQFLPDVLHISGTLLDELHLGA